MRTVSPKAQEETVDRVKLIGTYIIDDFCLRDIPLGANTWVATVKACKVCVHEASIAEYIPIVKIPKVCLASMGLHLVGGVRDHLRAIS